MPPKETYQQIKERNASEIRRRTSDRIAALMVEEAGRRRIMHGSSDYDRDHTHELSDEDDYNHRRHIRRYSMQPDEINEESANPRRPVSRIDNSIWLYLLSFIIILLIFNVFYLQHYILNNTALR